MDGENSHGRAFKNTCCIHFHQLTYDDQSREMALKLNLCESDGNDTFASGCSFFTTIYV